jgi:hypothetical protein
MEYEHNDMHGDRAACFTLLMATEIHKIMLVQPFHACKTASLSFDIVALCKM